MRNLASKKKIKKIKKIFKFCHSPLSMYIFYRTFLSTPYSILAWGNLDSNNIFFLNKLVYEFGGLCFLSVSPNNFDVLSNFRSILSSKPVISFSFSNLINLKKFVNVVKINGFLLNKNSRFVAAFVKLGSNILSRRFFSINFDTKLSKRRFFRKIIKVNLYRHKASWIKLNIAFYYYLIIILKAFYFYTIICQLYTK